MSKGKWDVRSHLSADRYKISLVLDARASVDTRASVDATLYVVWAPMEEGAIRPTAGYCPLSLS